MQATLAPELIDSLLVDDDVDWGIQREDGSGEDGADVTSGYGVVKVERRGQAFKERSSSLV